jgi:hypothetical protein
MSLLKSGLENQSSRQLPLRTTFNARRGRKKPQPRGRNSLLQDREKVSRLAHNQKFKVRFLVLLPTVPSLVEGLLASEAEK